MAKNFLCFLLLLFTANSSHATLIVNNTEYHHATSDENWPGLFDLDGDGVKDIRLYADYFQYFITTIIIKSYGEALGANQFALMDYGQSVNNQTTFLSAEEHFIGQQFDRSSCMSSPPPGCEPPGFPNVYKQYVGIKFYINGNVHYGWIEFLLRDGGEYFPLENWAGISRIAYDDEPNQTVTTGMLVNSSVLGINTLFKVYPNPAKDFLTISGDLTINAIEMYTIQGEKIYAIENANTTTSSIPLNSWSKGIYLLVIKSRERVEIKRIVKE